jgi:hypothetical protein
MDVTGRVNVTENRIAASTCAERKTKIGGWEKSDLQLVANRQTHFEFAALMPFI